jgi:hypothetical protein
MFGFGKKKSKADATLSVLDDAIRFATDRWLYFCEKLPFKEDVGLATRIAAFSVPFDEGAKNKFPPLRDAPDAVLLLIIAKGVQASGTHTRDEIEQALGFELPD